jgi:hypothetical protein
MIRWYEIVIMALVTLLIFTPALIDARRKR